MGNHDGEIISDGEKPSEVALGSRSDPEIWRKVAKAMSDWLRMAKLALNEATGSTFSEGMTLEELYDAAKQGRI